MAKINVEVRAGDPLAASNSLADLAARIKTEHAAAAASLRESVRHAIAAGELLVEAKALVPHGGWLPWLADHVSISERTAQLYMRIAKNRAEIEIQMRNDVADLTLNEAAALLMMSSDVRKLFAFMRQIEGLDGEELVQACLDAGVAVIPSPGYDPFHGRSDDERREWLTYILWLTTWYRDPSGPPHHVEWLLQRPFQNVDEWHGQEGVEFRARWGMRQLPAQHIAAWEIFLAERRTLSEAEIEAALDIATRTPPRQKPQRIRRPIRRPVAKVTATGRNTAKMSGGNAKF